MIEQIFLAPQHTPLGEALTISGDTLRIADDGVTKPISLEMPLPAIAPGLDRRMQALGLPLAFSFFAQDLNPVSLDADIAALSKSKYQDAIQVALDCKARYLLLPSLDQSRFQVTGEYRPWFGRTVTFWESLLEQLPAHHNLTLVMLNDQDASPDTLLTLAKRLNHPAFKTGLDTERGRLFSHMPPVDWLNVLGDTCCYVRMAHYSDTDHTLLPISDDKQEAPTLATHLALVNRKLAVSLVGNNLNDAKQAFQWLQEFVALQQAQYVSKRFLV